jgi:hypothetical protein
MSKTPEEILHEHHVNIGKRGGQSKTDEKKAASRKNLEKALAARWGKKYKLVRNED